MKKLLTPQRDIKQYEKALKKTEVHNSTLHPKTQPSTHKTNHFTFSDKVTTRIIINIQFKLKLENYEEPDFQRFVFCLEFFIIFKSYISSGTIKKHVHRQ